MPVPADRRWLLSADVTSLRLMAIARPRQHLLKFGLDQAFNEMTDLIADR